ncbi:MAG: tripartite tricarboxylate transporter TctB family protein [Treponema sp.]|nr:tripartite tricarboxylate transporter TctB family protein [Treponema sp.]
MTEKNLVKADFYTSIIIMAASISATVMAVRMPTDFGRGSDLHSAPGVVPALLGSIITILCFVMLVRSIVRAKGRVGISPSSFAAFVKDATTIRIASTMAFCLLYFFLLGNLPFMLLTFLFIFSFIVFFELDLKVSAMSQIRIFVKAAIVAVCSSVAITMLFEQVFFVRLP